MSARSELEALTSSMKTRTKAQEQIEAEIRAFRQKVKMAPLREQQFMDLTRDYGNAKANYESLLAKKNLSDLASNLEKRQQGEQFRVLDPANLPAGPTSPKRPLIAGAGGAFGLFIGIAIIVVKELLDKTIRGERDAELYLELPALGVIPTVRLEGEQKPRFSRIPWPRRAARAAAQ
jgi:uncharacterized protein involved in exopolysaccharide biosynthesis